MQAAGALHTPAYVGKASPVPLVKAIICLLPFLAWPALAQDEPAPAPPSAAALKRVARSCTADAARFCPALLGRPGAASPRSQAICLRPYRTSLALGCRAAVTAVLR